MPSDVVLVLPALYAAIGAGIAKGRRVAANTDGQPMLVDPAPPTLEALQELERAWRTQELGRHEWVVTRHRDEVDMTLTTTISSIQFTALLRYRQALRDWPSGASFPAMEHRPDPPAWLAAQIQ
ncbi:hypothetical protein D3C77_600320 [compost metagenome]